ncbi:MAG: protein kinase [Bradymonadaceae bacterium]
MPLDSSQYLVDDERGETPYRIREMFDSGEGHQIVLAEDESRDGESVCAKVPVHPDGAGPDERDHRWEALEHERDLLDRGLDLVPAYVDWLTIETGSGRLEPALVYDHLPGGQLHEWLRTSRPTGMEPQAALSIVDRVGRPCADLHELGLVHRYLDPRHVIVDEEGELSGLVGMGNATPIEEPPNPTRMQFDRPAYVAPEARNERSGETLTPRVDVYSLSALAVFLLTGREPREQVESPLGRKAHERLQGLEDERATAVVRAGIRTLAKERVESVDVQVELASGEVEPDALDLPELPEPWEGPEDVEGANRKLSPGPLVARAGDRDAPPPEADLGELGDADLDALDETEFGGLGDADLVDSFEGEAGGDAADSRSGADETADGDDDRRQVSMVDEHLADRQPEPDEDEQPPGPADSSLPPLNELPLKTRVLIGVVLPMALVLGVAVLGLLGVY